MTRQSINIFIALSSLLSISASANAISNVFAINLRANPNTLLTFPVNAPANNIISANASFDGFAMDFNSSATVLYGITTTFQFGTIDQATGNFTSIAAISGDGVSESNWSGLSMDPTTNTMFASASSGSGLNRLYSVNLATGATSLVATIPGATALFIDIAIDSQGNLYAHDIASDALFQVNKTTGATTLIGSTGIAANFAQGMDFDWETDTLYATLYTGGGTGSFASLSTTTGAATVITSTNSWNAEMEMAIKSPFATSTAPEPATLGLVGLGALICLRRRKTARL